MFNRNYFIHIEIWNCGREISSHYRIFYVKSWFPEKPEDITAYKINKFVQEFNVKPEQIHITAFNRI